LSGPVLVPAEQAMGEPQSLVVFPANTVFVIVSEVLPAIAAPK
jgi:hypothetical protein